MFLNVWGIIWPNQKIALGIKEADADAKAKAGAHRQLASRINTLLSLPMLTSMAMYQTLFGRLNRTVAVPDDDLEDLDDLVRRVDPDRWLASRFIGDRLARADVVALYAFDHRAGARQTRGAQSAGGRDPAHLVARGAGRDLRTGGRVRAHPVAQALAAARLAMTCHGSRSKR